MIECNRFELSASISEGFVHWSLETDLPERAIIMVSAKRFFLDSGERIFTWPIFEDRFFSTPSQSPGVNGAEGEFEIESLEAEGLLQMKKTACG